MVDRIMNIAVETDPSAIKSMIEDYALHNQQLIDRVVKIVNIAIEADPSAMRALFENRVLCNQRMADDPEIQVLKENKNVGYTIGVLGLLSGIVGTRNYKGHNGFSKIWAVYNVDCLIHGVTELESGGIVGDTCQVKGCEEKLVLGDLLRVEQVPEE